MKEETVQEVQEILSNDQLAKELSDKLVEVEEAPEHVSIYKVPSELRKSKNDAYNPRVVSIGPLHRDNNTNLLAMKEHKWRYMLLIFQQTHDFVNTTKCLKACTDAFYGSGSYPLNKKVRESYAVDLKNIEEHDLAEMMLLDGCFILQLFLRNHQPSCSNDDQANDPIFSPAWMLPALRHDLTLLENQIPFFILKKLYDTIRPYIVKYTLPDSVTTLALKFFQPMYKGGIVNFSTGETSPSSYHIIEVGGPAKSSNQQTIKEGTDPEHLLHLLHNFFGPSSGDTIEGWGPAKPSNQWKFELCASDLYDGGVQFEIGSTDSQLSSIEFNDGVIKIPQLYIDDKTNSLFRNLIAFEQCHLRIDSHHITSYVMVMKSLIHSKEDFKLLKKKGIITEEVPGENYCDDFESILNHINLKHFCFGKLCNDVNEYSKSHKFYFWYKFKARLRRDMKSLHDKYFSSPWSFIAFLAAVVVFCLAVIRTYFAIPHRYLVLAG